MWREGWEREGGGRRVVVEVEAVVEAWGVVGLIKDCG
jgi:hypothetical protein